MEYVMITLNDGSRHKYIKGITLGDVIKDLNCQEDIICGKLNNSFINEFDQINRSGSLELLTVNSPDGNRIYEKGLIYLFSYCSHLVLGDDTRIRIRHSIDKGVFFEIDKNIKADELDNIKKLMKEKIKANIPFVKIETTMDEALSYFKNLKREDKVKTLFYNKSNYVTLYRFEDNYNYIMGALPSSSGILKQFDLTLIENKGIILRYPSVYDNGKLIKYTHHEQYFNSIDEYLSWAKILNISSIGELNDAIVNSKKGELINLSETIQDYRLKQIAEQIVSKKGTVKLILLSGPSSSGKTTSARKLSLYLKTMGLNPIPISLDDYFLNRNETPLNENGKPDFESLRAIDIKLFNNQMNKLLKGNKVCAPTFDFIEGKKIFNKNIVMKENDVLVIEGLHALSDDILKDIPKKNKFKIYISPLVYLNIDDDNRINLTDIRLIRRMVRDNRTRGYIPSKTLSTWKEVRDGEEKYVFPYQDNADAIFNTFLAYELAALKVYAEPLLYTVKEDDPEYQTALRLIRLFDLVLPLPSDDVPSLSILREFIGNSYFE